jgi:hypothetical protein
MTTLYAYGWDCFEFRNENENDDFNDDDMMMTLATMSKVVPVHIMNAYRGNEVWLHSS